MALTTILFLVMGSLCLLVSGCDRADIWGTEQYFERVTGAKFNPVSSPVHCSHEAGPDVVAYAMVKVPDRVAEELAASSSALVMFPKQMSYEKERTLRTWRRGSLSPEAREAFDLALRGALHAIRESQCKGVSEDLVQNSVKLSIARSGTFYAYQFMQVPGEAHVMPEALDFWIFDPIDRILYELVNFS